MSQQFRFRFNFYFISLKSLTTMKTDQGFAVPMVLVLLGLILWVLALTSLIQQSLAWAETRNFVIREIYQKEGQVVQKFYRQILQLNPAIIRLRLQEAHLRYQKNAAMASQNWPLVSAIEIKLLSVAQHKKILRQKQIYLKQQITFQVNTTNAHITRRLLPQTISIPGLFSLSIQSQALPFTLVMLQPDSDPELPTFKYNNELSVINPRQTQHQLLAKTLFRNDLNPSQSWRWRWSWSWNWTTPTALTERKYQWKTLFLEVKTQDRL